MYLSKISVLVLAVSVFAACQASQTESAKSGSAPVNQESATYKIVGRPGSVAERMKARGEQDEAVPELVVESPKDGETIASSTVKIQVKIGGDLKGLKMGKDADGTGNHVHVILDNQPYAAHYMWNEGFELRNVSDGEHTLRLFASRPWHESYKNDKAFQIIKFTVTGGQADETKPVTDGNNNKMADQKPAADKAEGADVKESKAGKVDFKAPLLTYSRPKGEYKGNDAEAVMIDFWLTNAKLKGDGGEFRVRYTINGAEPGILEKWEPVWVSGLKPGKNTIKLELINQAGDVVENGGYNSTLREITTSSN